MKMKEMDLRDVRDIQLHYRRKNWYEPVTLSAGALLQLCDQLERRMVADIEAKLEAEEAEERLAAEDYAYGMQP